MNLEGIRLQLLGPVRVRRAGEDVFAGSGHRAAVLAVLALHGDASLEQIVAALWEGDPPASANAMIYTHVNALRDLIGGPVLSRADGVYRLQVHGPAIDAVRFEELRKQARQRQAAGDRLAELSTLRKGLRLWHGEPLAGVPGPFADAQRARLSELRLTSEQRQAEVLLDLGRHGDAITALRPLVAAHRRHEPLHRLLMIALQAAGQLTEALGVYEDFRGSLVRETGTEPTAALRRVREQIGARSLPESLVLRAVAFLGDGATIDEVLRVTGLPRATVHQQIELARAAGVLSTVSGTVAFRDPLTGYELHGSTPAALRSTVHSFFAEVIADSFGPPERVAAQLLLAGPVPLGPIASRWLLEHVEHLATESSATAVELLRRAHLQHLSDQETHVALSMWLARLLFGQGRDAVSEAGWVAARTEDLEVQAEMLWIAACSHDRQGHHAAAADVARSTLSARRHAQPWLDRFRTLILRLRLNLPGEPTAPRHGRSDVVSARKASAYRRSIATDGPL